MNGRQRTEATFRRSPDLRHGDRVQAHARDAGQRDRPLARRAGALVVAEIEKGTAKRKNWVRPIVFRRPTTPEPTESKTPFDVHPFRHESSFTGQRDRASNCFAWLVAGAACPASTRKEGVAMPARSAFNACTMSTQYTLRAIPPVVDRALRRRARQEAKSLNTVAVEALARGLELDAKPVRHTDLDGLIGTWQEDPAFDRAVAEFERIDADVWK